MCVLLRVVVVCCLLLFELFRRCCALFAVVVCSFFLYSVVALFVYCLNYALLMFSCVVFVRVPASVFVVWFYSCSLLVDCYSLLVDCRVSMRVVRCLLFVVRWSSLFAQYCLFFDVC